jgi:peptidyl-prolyl cis-trans isomerase C
MRPRLFAPVKQWLREPLLQFLLIGLALFAVQRALPPGRVDQTDRKRIVLTEDDVSQLALMWQAQGHPPPTPEEMLGLLESRIREEVLYREALAMGLDKDDTIVKRRMMQKMDFLAEDLSDLREPRREELKEWFAKNAGRFTVPGRISFRHLYFSFDKHGEKTAAAAAAALKQVAGKPSDSSEAAALADPFMFLDYYGDRPFDYVAKTFGPKFARALFELKAGSWQGPIESGYGWHLVFIDSLTPARLPEFEEVETDVKTVWVDEQRAQFKRKAFEAMRAGYEIVLPKVLANAAPVAAATPAEIGGW